jgi:hypothetical protein
LLSCLAALSPASASLLTRRRPVVSFCPSPLPLAETKASDLVLARSLGLISKLKRHGYYKLVRRQGTPDDENRTARIMEVERERLDGVEERRRERLARIREEAEQADRS